MLCALRLILLFRYRFDSDEPQHMHVAWAWSRGLMQYRDVFDNHMPLFHIVWSPLFRFAGDDVNVLYLARLSVLPFFFAAIALVYFIADRLFDRRIASWAAVCTAACPPFFLGMLEFRTDDAWVVLFLACIAVLLSGLEPLAKSLVAGLLLGIAFGVSMKSVLFAGAIGIAMLVIRVVARRPLKMPVLPFVLTALSVPATIAMLFYLAGAWKPFVYCVFSHNATAPFDQWWRPVWAIVLVPVAWFVGRSYVELSRLFVFVVCASFVILLSAFWPVLSFESYLPFYPLAIALVAPFLVRVPRLALASLAVAVIAVPVTAHIWRDEAHEEVALIRQVLQITRPSDQVMDLKGESLFRRRPYWLVLESITHRKMRHNKLRDDIAAALVRSGTAVLASTDFPANTRSFVRKNYVPWGRLWVVGHRILPAPPDGSSIPVRISVPSTYIVVDAHGVVDATVDGKPVGSGIDLARGYHNVAMRRLTSRPLIIWSGVTRSGQFMTRLRDMQELMRSRHDVRRVAAKASAVDGQD